MAYDVEIRGGAWTVTYTEPAGTLKFSFELGIQKEILFFPNAKIWREKAPDWAKNRREEILSRIEAAFGSRGCEVIEIESF
jgi:hypothetical protein